MLARAADETCQGSSSGGDRLAVAALPNNTGAITRIAPAHVNRMASGAGVRKQDRQVELLKPQLEGAHVGRGHTVPVSVQRPDLAA